MTFVPTTYDPLSAGSYSIEDQGCSGDTYAISPQPYPVPGYVRVFEDLRTAYREAVDACELQRGYPCWVLKRSDTLQRCGQRCGKGECANCGPGKCAGGFAGINSPGSNGSSYSGTVRRSVEAAWKPIMQVNGKDTTAVLAGCTLPIWQRIFYVADQPNPMFRSSMTAPGKNWMEAVEAAMLLARRQAKPRVIVTVRPQNGGGSRVVPLVYVDPGGTVRAIPPARGPNTMVEPLSDFEAQQYWAQSSGASILPFAV